MVVAYSVRLFAATLLLLVVCATTTVTSRAEGQNVLPLCNGNTFYADTNNCKKYYSCEGIDQQHWTCPGGREWHAVSNTCQPPEVAQCSMGDSTSEASSEETSSRSGSGETTEPSTNVTGSGETTEPSRNVTGSEKVQAETTEPTTDVTSGSGSGETTEPSTDVTSGSGSRETTDPSTDVTSGSGSSTSARPSSVPLTYSLNPCKGRIFYPFPDDCTKYYKCNGISSNLMTCPEGLHWNPSLKMCDWPEFVNCNSLPAYKGRNGI